jgi:hypothetical protein
MEEIHWGIAFTTLILGLFVGGTYGYLTTTSVAPVGALIGAVAGSITLFYWWYIWDFPSGALEKPIHFRMRAVIAIAAFCAAPRVIPILAELVA